MLIMEDYFINHIVMQLNNSIKIRDTVLYLDFVFIENNTTYFITIYKSNKIWNNMMKMNMKLYQNSQNTLLEWYVINTNKLNTQIIDIIFDTNNSVKNNTDKNDETNLIYVSRYINNCISEIPIPTNYNYFELYNIDDMFFYLFRYMTILITNNKYNLSGLILKPKTKSFIEFNNIIINNRGIYDYEYIHMNEYRDEIYYNVFYNNKFNEYFKLKIDSMQSILYYLINKPSESMRKYLAIDLYG